jgi:hypothetical protein
VSGADFEFIKREASHCRSVQAPGARERKGDSLFLVGCCS